MLEINLERYHYQSIISVQRPICPSASLRVDPGSWENRLKIESLKRNMGLIHVVGEPPSCPRPPMLGNLQPGELWLMGKPTELHKNAPHASEGHA